MSKRTPAWKKLQATSKEWVEANYNEWDQDRCAGATRPAPGEGGGGPADLWYSKQEQIMMETKQKRTESGTADASDGGGGGSAAAGAARPAPEEGWPEECIDIEHAKEVWKRLCNTTFPKLASFEPMQYVSVVAGRPVVVPCV